ncbi:FAD binding domain-containing protein [Acuticoccus sp. MNP-M23]|uniref:FAD binding domain-containing protein n=1 Tax=Acuticoccus sp. MNP-M23 TaxID=3072793 RepID=UPI0028167199|nr:FAD binding domain-containing protein [Acuticoccus sp. MNP-M23]WMS40877.1 FAD binding domain-containing protein [Acuticoccus sp. MNP-M23]
MRPAAFDYHAPATIDEAVALLGVHGANARVIAGGQSLVPAMTARLARPTHLIDINRLPRAERPAIAGGRLRIPPLMRHVDFEVPVADSPLGAVLAELSAAIGQLAVRMRGTFCGAIANGDPASEWCLAAVVLNADVIVRSKARGVRTIAASAFFETILTTVMADDELVVEVQLPLLADTTRFGFSKIARRHGHYGAALGLCIYDRDETRMRDVRIGVGAVEAVPRRLSVVEALLERQEPSLRLFRQAADAAADTVSPIDSAPDDISHKRDLTRTTVRRALEASLP